MLPGEEAGNPMKNCILSRSLVLSVYASHLKLDVMVFDSMG